MPCPDLGALRASLDGAESAAPAQLQDHVRACATCTATLAELRRNAELAAPAIAMTAPDADVPQVAVEAAFARLEQRRARLLSAGTAAGLERGAETPPETAPGHDGGRENAAAAPVLPLRRGRLARLGGRARAAAAGLVAAILLTGIVATPGGRAAAADFLARFRSERFEVVALNNSQSTQLGQVMWQLVSTGVFSADESQLYSMGEPRAARDLAEASRLAGFPVEAVSRQALPSGVATTPQRVHVMQARTIRVTFHRDQAVAYYKSHGRPDVQIPERFDGTALLVQVPSIVVQEYPGRDGVARLIVGKAGTLGLDTDGGANLEELRDVMLNLPGLPKETVEQLRDINDWRTTLPLPVPTDELRWRQANVGGAEALSFADPTGKMHALLWQRDGHIYGVAGVVDTGEAQDVANSLR
jgi:hypothetical protein